MHVRSFSLASLALVAACGSPRLDPNPGVPRSDGTRAVHEPAGESGREAMPAYPDRSSQFEPAELQPIDQRWQGWCEPGAAALPGARFTFRAERPGWIVGCEQGGLTFDWRLDPRSGELLGGLVVEEGGARVELCAGWELGPRDQNARIVEDAHEQGSVRVERSDGVTLALTPVGRALRIELEGPPHTPWALEPGGLLAGPGVRSVRVLQLPYLDHAAVGVVLLEGGGVRYVTMWHDIFESHASRISASSPGSSLAEGAQRYGQHARYSANTHMRGRDLREVLWVAYSDELLDVLPALRREAAAYGRESSQLSYVGSYVTPFKEVERAIRLWSALGLEDLQLWQGRWQKGGDVPGYPDDVWPPRPEWGGLEGMRELRAAAGRAGYGFALHHNWIFNDAGIQGASIAGTELLRARYALALVDEVEGVFHDQLSTQGSYADGLTAFLPPADMDAEEKGWGLVRTTLTGWRDVLERLRVIHGPPLIGSGSVGFGNLLWAGIADVMQGDDGMQVHEPAQPITGMRVPVVPEYVLHGLRPLGVRAGLGTLESFFSVDPGAGRLLLARDRDLYLSVAMLYGAAPYLHWEEGARVDDVARDWWEWSACARRLARPDDEVVRITYGAPDTALVELSRALEAGSSFALGATRLHVQRASGLRLWVNLTPHRWAVGETSIAPWGRLVRGPDIEAGLVVEADRELSFVRSDARLFLDGRGEPAELDGIRTNGGVGVKWLAEGHISLHPFEYRRTISADGAQVISSPDQLRVLPHALGASEGDALTVYWLGLEGEPVAQDTAMMPADGLDLGWQRFRARGAIAAEVELR